MQKRLTAKNACDDVQLLSYSISTDTFKINVKLGYWYMIYKKVTNKNETPFVPRHFMQVFP